MSDKERRAAAALLLLETCAACGVFLPLRSCQAGLPLDSIRLPPGFAITLYADKVPGARSIAIGARGTVFVGTRDEGSV